MAMSVPLRLVPLSPSTLSSGLTLPKAMAASAALTTPSNGPIRRVSPTLWLMEPWDLSEMNLGLWEHTFLKREASPRSWEPAWPSGSLEAGPRALELQAAWP